VEKSKNPIVIGIIFITVIIIGAIVLVSLKSASPPVTSYNPDDKEKPKIEISEQSFDLGKMKVSETKNKDIVIKNTGTRPLSIFNVTTSCDCTFAETIIGGKTSPKFSMQQNKTWQGELPPDQSAILKITYQPSIMPIKGSVSRTVYFKTNDPNLSNTSIKFNAYVE